MSATASRPSHPTLPSLLRDGGYRTANSANGIAAGGRGSGRCGRVMRSSGNYDGAVDYFSHIDTTGQHDLWDNDTEVFRPGYYPDMITERAVEYIRSSARGPDPFYLHLNYTLPHWPWEGRGDIEVSEAITRAMREGGGWGLFHFDGGSLDKYREMVEILDDCISQVLAALEDNGLADDTIVVFTSDNGGERFGFMWPLVGEKGDLEEGGIRVPLIIRWPAAIRNAQVTHEPVITMDLTATLLDVAGVSAAATHPLDGDSLVPWLTGDTPRAPRDLIWRTRHQGAVRRGRYKLLYDRSRDGCGRGSLHRSGRKPVSSMWPMLGGRRLTSPPRILNWPRSFSRCGTLTTRRSFRTLASLALRMSGRRRADLTDSVSARSDRDLLRTAPGLRTAPVRPSRSGVWATTLTDRFRGPPQRRAGRLLRAGQVRLGHTLPPVPALFVDPHDQRYVCIGHAIDPGEVAEEVS